MSMGLPNMGIGLPDIDMGLLDIGMSAGYGYWSSRYV